MWPRKWITASPSRQAWRYGALLLFAVLALVLYGAYLTPLPWGFHDWAQSDRLALALGFYDYNFDFFHPRTLSLSTVDSVTGVEPPVQAYLAGLLGLLVGRSHITIAFRCLDLTMMVVGFWFLFRLLFESTGRVLAGLVPVAFLLSSPIFLYYSGTYTPDPFSASLVFVALYFYWRFYYHDRQFRHLLWATGLTGLAMFVKIMAGVYFIGFTGVVLAVSYVRPSLLNWGQKLTFLGVVTLIILLQISYVLYHRYLNEAYGNGLFLVEALPIKSMAQHREIWEKVRDTWRLEYFTPAGYALVKICLGLMAAYAVVRWRRAVAYLPLALFLVLATVGIGVLYVLLGPQLLAHDYYPIAPLVPLLVLVVCCGVKALVDLLGSSRVAALGLPVLLLIGIAVPTYVGMRHHYARMTDPYKPHSDYYTYRWLVGGEQKLRAAGVPDKAFILVYGESAPNTALVHFNHRGITWDPIISDTPPDTLLRIMAGRRLEYLVVSQQIRQRMEQENPALLPPFQLVSCNEQFCIFKPRQRPVIW